LPEGVESLGYNTDEIYSALYLLSIALK